MTAHCDVCGKVYSVSGQSLYSLASKFNDEGKLISFRHYQCERDREANLIDQKKQKLLDNMGDIIRQYRCRDWVDENGDSLQLLDVLAQHSPDGTVGRAQEEILDLAADIVDMVMSLEEDRIRT